MTDFRSSRLATVIVICLAIFVDVAVYGVIMPTIPSRIVDKLHLDASYVGVLVGIYAFGLIFITPFISFYSDRFNNRKIPMLLGLAGLIITTLAFAYTDSFAGLAISRFGQGVSAGISWTIGLAMISDVYQPNELGSVMGYVLSANSFGFLIGPPVGGIMSQFISQEAPYLFCTGLALLDLMGRLYIKPEIPNGDLSETSGLLAPPNAQNPSSQGQGPIYSFLNVQVLITCLGIIISAGVFSGIEPTLPIYLAAKYNFKISEIGALWYGRKNITAFGLLFYGISCILLGFSFNLWTLIVSLLFFGFTAGVAITPSLPEFGDFAQMHGGKLYAQAYALYNISYSVGMIFGPIFGGYLYESFGFEFQMLVFGLICVSASPIFMYFWWIHSPKLPAE